VAIPGLKYEFGNKVPEAMQPFWNSEMERTLHSPDWWNDLWQRAGRIDWWTAAKWPVSGWHGKKG
jgi:hypothetical protein